MSAPTKERCDSSGGPGGLAHRAAWNPGTSDGCDEAPQPNWTSSNGSPPATTSVSHIGPPCIVSKHRNGPTGMVRLAFLDHYTKFANMARGA